MTIIYKKRGQTHKYTQTAEQMSQYILAAARLKKIRKKDSCFRDCEHFQIVHNGVVVGVL